ncbi:MAG: T9SS type A sorting domain-containing protein, partial [Bacteroidota bacterium]
EVKPLGSMKLTTQKFFRINGGSTQLRGVSSDIVLPNAYTYLESGEQRQANPLEWTEIDAANFEQDRTKAPIVDDFCDRYTAPPASPICPGGSEAERVVLTESTTITEANGAWTLTNTQLPPGFEVTVDWGDGTRETVESTQLPLSHVYRDTGGYSICLTYVAYDDFGDICWERNTCTEITTSIRDRNVPLVAVKAYPNPTDGILHLAYPLLHGYPEVTVFNAAGQPVRKLAQLRELQLSLSGLPGGVYVVRLRFPDGAMARKLVILR